MTHVSDAAARLDRLPVSSFHRRTAALLAYVFVFELGDLSSFAYAAPALRQQWDLSIGTIATITSASFVGMGGRRVPDSFGFSPDLLTSR